MDLSFAATALLMGLAGGPHCLAMCGAACAGLGRAANGQRQSSMWLFQVGRLVGYSALGGFAAASMQGLGWMSVHLAALRPVWSLFHVAAALLGLMLIWQARQPIWLEVPARKVWNYTRTLINRGSSDSSVLSTTRAGTLTVGIGLLWALLPCGLLYSALLVAALSGGVVQGSVVMALFALGSGVSLMAGPWLWLRLRQRKGSGEWAIRLAGLALFATSSWALWMSLVHNTAPWCSTI